MSRGNALADTMCNKSRVSENVEPPNFLSGEAMYVMYVDDDLVVHDYQGTLVNRDKQIQTNKWSQCVFQGEYIRTFQNLPRFIDLQRSSIGLSPYFIGVVTRTLPMGRIMMHILGCYMMDTCPFCDTDA